MDTSHQIESRIGPAGMRVMELGQGPRIVFVHGGGEGGLSAWRAQLPLAERYRLVIPYRPGYGDSPSDDTEDFERQAAPIAELLGEGAHVVAQSYGVLVAVYAARLRPDAIWSLTMVESGSSSIARGKPAVDAYEQQMGELARAKPSDLDAHVRAIFKILDPLAVLPTPLPPPMLAWARRLGGFRWPWEGIVPVQAIRDAGFPLLAVTGGQRQMYEEIADSLAEALGSERVVVPGPHALQSVGAPFNALLEEFFTRAEARPWRESYSNQPQSETTRRPNGY